MTSIRKLFFIVATIAMAAFAPPSLAAQPAKIFGLTMDTVPSGNFIAGQVNTLSAKYTNLTPNGNSTINWVYLTVPATLWGVYPAPPAAALTPLVKFPQGGTVYNIDTTSDPNNVTIIVNNIPGVGSGGQSWYFTVDVLVPASPACGTYHFSAQAFTGNSGTQGQPFAYQSASSKPDIAVASGCTLKFTTQPTSADAGTTITGQPYTPLSTSYVEVSVYDGASVAMSFTGPVSMDIAPGTGTAGAVLSGKGPINAVAGVAKFPALSINTAGTNYQLRASVGSPYVDSDPFWITGVAGTVNCTDSNYASSDGVTDPNKTYVDFLVSDPGNWGVRRGPNSLDGTNNGCKKVGISLTLDGNVATFIYDKSILNQVGNFKYWIVWPETTVNADDTKETSYGTDGLGTANRSTAGYGEKRPLVAWVFDGGGNPVYVPVLNCASDDLKQGSALMPQIPDTEPFSTLGATYTDYAPSAYAKACIAAHVMVGSGPDPVTGKFLVIYADKFVDQVDTVWKY
jgi:hypothetical protein